MGRSFQDQADADARVGGVHLRDAESDAVRRKQRERGVQSDTAPGGDHGGLSLDERGGEALVGDLHLRHLWQVGGGNRKT